VGNTIGGLNPTAAREEEVMTKRKQIEFDLERHGEVRTKLKIDRAVCDLVAMGLVEVTGKNSLGQTVYRVTEEGKLHPPLSWNRH
jgi:hypothetical protein